jgi:hypothetical protein
MTNLWHCRGEIQKVGVIVNRSIVQPMPRSWRPPPMRYPPYPPWAGWYDQWIPSPMHFHPRWSGPTEGFGHGGYYTRDGHYRSIAHQPGKKAPRQENWTVQNDKHDHPVPSKTTEAPRQPHKQSVRGSKCLEIRGQSRSDRAEE